MGMELRPKIISFWKRFPSLDMEEEKALEFSAAVSQSHEEGILADMEGKSRPLERNQVAEDTVKP